MQNKVIPNQDTAAAQRDSPSPELYTFITTVTAHNVLFLPPSVLYTVSLFFFSTCSPCTTATVRARCAGLQCADLHSLPPIGSRISLCHFFLMTCIIIAAPLDQTLDNLSRAAISQKKKGLNQH